MLLHTDTLSQMISVLLRTCAIPGVLGIASDALSTAYDTAAVTNHTSLEAAADTFPQRKLSTPTVIASATVDGHVDSKIAIACASGQFCLPATCQSLTLLGQPAPTGPVSGGNLRSAANPFDEQVVTFPGRVLRSLQYTVLLTLGLAARAKALSTLGWHAQHGSHGQHTE